MQRQLKEKVIVNEGGDKEQWKASNKAVGDPRRLHQIAGEKDEQQRQEHLSIPKRQLKNS